jgi:signal transduction histidine kinase
MKSPSDHTFSVRWALALSLVFVCAVIAVTRLHLRSEVSAPTPTVVTSAFMAEAGATYPTTLPVSSSWKSVTLPDNWDGRRPDYVGYVWYRLPAPEALSEWKRPALYLPAAGMNAEVWLDGQRVGGAGRMQWPVSRHFYTPQLIEIPPGLIRGASAANKIWVLVAGHPGYRSGLAPVWIGEHDDLFGAWRARRFWQIEGNAATVVINLTIAVFVLFIGWRDRAHSAYLWFGAATVVWALRNLNYWVTNPAIPDLLFAELCVSGSAWFVALFSIFSMRFAEDNQPGYVGPRWLKRAALAYASIATVYFLSATDYARANAGFALFAAIGVGFSIWSMLRLVRLAFARPTGDMIAVACGAVVYLALLLNDYAIGVETATLGEIFMRQYASLPLFVAVTATLARRYMEAQERTRELASSLQREVAAQRAQLEESFAQLREAEREQARMQERTRVMGDLHDGLGMHLATALRQSRSAAHNDPLLTETLLDCMDELRIAVDSLDEHERDPLSLLGTLRFRMAPRFESLGVRLDWHVAHELGELPTLDPSAALNLLRIVQEALGNALKHSGASVVTLALNRARQGVCIQVADNGCGFDPATVARGHGIGQLQSRASRIGASIAWRRERNGMTLEVTLPQNSTPSSSATL